MPMRVIAGEYRHRKLSYPENNPSIRPTKDRIREAFFSSLGDISEKSFLDLYAGSGSMGIEAISRGASYSTFVDCNEISISYIKKNLNELNIKNAEVIKLVDEAALSKFINQGRSFDIIYLDPPYESDCYLKSLNTIFEFNLLTENGVVAFEANKNIEINPLWKVKIKEYHYGEIKVVVLRR